MGVYVHNSDLDFNTVIYCFMRAYHLPTLEGQELPLQDTWFIVPAVQYGPVVNLVNANIEASALTMIDAGGRTVRGSRINPNIAAALTKHEIAQIEKEAFDIPLWEKTNQKSFPYDTMFDKVSMTARLNESGLTKQDILSQTTSNILYNEIRTKVRNRPPCTTCGKGKTR
jgi:hypothetical protein